MPVYDCSGSGVFGASVPSPRAVPVVRNSIHVLQHWLHTKLVVATISYSNSQSIAKISKMAEPARAAALRRAREMAAGRQPPLSASRPPPMSGRRPPSMRGRFSSAARDAPTPVARRAEEPMRRRLPSLLPSRSAPVPGRGAPAAAQARAQRHRTAPGESAACARAMPTTRARTQSRRVAGAQARRTRCATRRPRP